MRKFSWGIGAVMMLGCGGEEGYAVQPSPMPGGPVTDGPVMDFEGAQPTLPGEVVRADRAAPPLSGGTLLVLRGQKTAIVADPDRDQVLVVDLAKVAVTRTLTLEAGAEPGRAADDANGNVHLALRGTGQLLTFNPQTGEVVGRRSACAYPRGVAVADADGQVHVACAEGNLVTFSTDATSSGAIRNLKLDRDLRDVVVASDGLWVSRFRSAEILRLDAAGKLLRRTSLPGATGSLGQSASSVAWRMVAGSNGGVVVVHQRAFAGEVVASPGGYGASGTPGGIVGTGVSTVSEGGVTMGTSVALSAPLPVDVAQSAVSGRLLLASGALEHPSIGSSFGRTLLLRPSQLNFQESPNVDGAFGFAVDPSELDAVPRGQLVAVAFAGDTPIMQYREPSSLVVGDRGLALPGDSVVDTGNQLFHLETGSGLACASCHPEGHEDGRVWTFAGFGPRRTQSLRGGLLGTEPFHWDGAETDFSVLTGDVMQGRMAGPALTAEQNVALAGYLDALPAIPAPAAAMNASVERGKTLFNDTTVGCATCHSGSRYSNDQTMDVGGNDGALQVPGLVGLWARAPYLHNGCAQTIGDRFRNCDTGKHGNVASLSSQDLQSLTDYLETL